MISYPKLIVSVRAKSSLSIFYLKLLILQTEKQNIFGPIALMATNSAGFVQPMGSSLVKICVGSHNSRQKIEGFWNMVLQTAIRGSMELITSKHLHITKILRRMIAGTHYLLELVQT